MLLGCWGGLAAWANYGRDYGAWYMGYMGRQRGLTRPTMHLSGCQYSEAVNTVKPTQ